MRLHIATRHRALLICTGDDARDDEPEPDAPAVGPRLPYSADVEPAPAPAWDDRMEPYEDQRIGFHQ